MSDVQRLTIRQKTLLIIIEQHDDGISRERLAELLSAKSTESPVSRATLIRDLGALREQGLVHTAGKGPSTRYVPRTAGELLRYFDMPSYFGLEPDFRPLTRQSVESFFDDLRSHQILFDEERDLLDTMNADFQARLATRDSDILKREQERFTIELAWKSSRIEGNTYSLLETEELIKTAKEAPGRTSEEAQMILNHKAALEMTTARSDEYCHLSVDAVVHVHSLLVRGLDIKEGIRQQPVGITGTNYQPPSGKADLARYLETAVRIANEKNHPIEAAVIISALIAYLQPFSDGNKRTARLIGNAVLLAHGYAQLSYRSVNEIIYKESVLLVDEQHSLYWYKRLFIEQFIFTCEKYFK